MIVDEEKAVGLTNIIPPPPPQILAKTVSKVTSFVFSFLVGRRKVLRVPEHINLALVECSVYIRYI